MTTPGASKLRDAAYAAIWSILPDKLEAVLSFLEARAAGHTMSKAQLRARGFTGIQAKPFAIGAEEQGKQIAVLPLRGTIAHHAGWEMQASGGTSTVAFGNAFDAAMNNTNVGAIVIDCDSGGGTVEGVAELFAKIHAARGKGKEIIAVANAHMHSAAYWICVAADQIVITPSGQIGNIGVMTVRTDYSAQEAEAGVKRTIIKAGQFKGEGAPFEPMTAEEEAATLAKVETIYGMFASDVAKGRGDTIANVKAGYGEGRSLTAREAVKAGLADRIASLEQVLAEFGAKAPAANGPRSMTSLKAETPSEEVCPDCGHVMQEQDGEMVCPECDTSETDAAADTMQLAASAFAAGIAATSGTGTPMTASAAAPTTPITPQPTAIQQDITMPEPTNTPAPTQAEMLATLKAAEKERRDQITALCTDHGMTLKAMEYINADLTVAQVKDAILAEKKSTTVANRPKVSVTSVEQRSDRDPKKGFANHREFLVAVAANRARDLSQVKDERLLALAQRDGNDDAAEGEVAYMLPNAFTATAGSDEAGNYSDSRGGFLGNQVSTYPGLLQTGFDGDPLAGRSQDIPMATTTVKLNARVDKNHSTSVSGGFTVSRRAETASQNATRMQMEQVTLQVNSLFGFSYATEELLTDSPISFAAIVDAGFRDQFGAHLLNEKINGLGDSEFRGILNCGATVSQAKESGQSAATITHANVTKMRSRCWGYGNAVWIANHDTYPQLAALAVGIGTSGALVYQNSIVEDRPDMLLGRPIFYTEWCATLGTVGDLMLLNMSQYLEGTYQPLQSAESIHVRFLNHERAFKFWTRNAADAWWRTALTPAKSSVTLSPFVTLATRA